MELAYKPDMPECCERFGKWWQGDYFGRCAIAVYAPKDGVPHADPPPPPAKVGSKWMDFDYIKKFNDWILPRTFYGGEAIPVWNPGYPGWTFIPCFMGAKIDLDDDTGWVNPVISHGALTDYDYKDLVIDEDNAWWRLTLDMMDFAARESKGKSLPGMFALGGCGDTLAGIRGSNELLMDMVDCPDYVREWEMHLMKMWVDVYETLYNKIQTTSEGSTSWFKIWGPGKCYPTHNDFAYMISPDMFDDVFVPALTMQSDYLDYVVHHVDGEGNFNHIDSLLEIDGIQAIQVLPGAGKPSPLAYTEICHKVQQKGKLLHVTIGCDEVAHALDTYSAKGLFIETCCATEKEARELLAYCEKHSKV